MAGSGLRRTSELPNPLLIAVSADTIYIFKYRPKGFKVKLKKNAEVAHWPRSQVRIELNEPGSGSVQFNLIVNGTDLYALEIPTGMGAGPTADLFIQAVR